jgi:hypothetical protein
MKQTEFRRWTRGPSQCDKIRDHLAASSQWVTMPELWRVSGAFAVHSRISDLRKQGYEIEQRSERAEDGTVMSYYRLTP